MASCRLNQSLVIAVSVLLLASSAWAEICRGSKVRKAILDEDNKAVILTEHQITKAKTDHAPWGVAECPKLLVHREYLVCFDLERRVPLWVSYTLKRADLGPAKRLDAFRSDPRLTEEENPSCAAYKGSGYDRGHSVPRCDMNRDDVTQVNTFFLTNIGAQTPKLNRGMWRWLEETVRAYADESREIHVTSGAVFLGALHRLPNSNVGIPRQFFKIVVRKDTGGRFQPLAFLLTNGQQLPIPPGTQGIPGKQASAAAASYFPVQK